MPKTSLDAHCQVVYYQGMKLKSAPVLKFDAYGFYCDSMLCKQKVVKFIKDQNRRKIQFKTLQNVQTPLERSEKNMKLLLSKSILPSPTQADFLPELGNTKS